MSSNDILPNINELIIKKLNTYDDITRDLALEAISLSENSSPDTVSAQLQASILKLSKKNKVSIS